MGKEPKILFLTLKSKWYDAIASGEKTEEYRSLTEYWAKRLCSKIIYAAVGNTITSGSDSEATFKEFDVVRFARGGHFHPSIPQMTVECLGISIGTGNPDFGAEPGKEYFVIKLGKIIDQ